MVSRQAIRLATLVTATASIAAAVGTMINIVPSQNRWLLMAVTGAFAIMISTFLGFFLRTLQKNPTPLRFGILGNPGSGKTVYLSVLFHEIQARKEDTVSFQPYGVETVEEVTRNINLLARGKWLPSTESGTVFPFRANARLFRGLFPRQYTVEIGDYAGEHIRELDPTSEEWLHRTKYFEYITGSDVLLLAIDGDRLTNDSPSQTEQMLNNMIASFQVLLEAKGLRPGRRTAMPVAIVVLKSDRLAVKEVSEEDVRSRIGRLLSLCANRCRRTSVFFVSAVGEVQEDGFPPSVIRPINVCEPVLWALESVVM